MSDTTNTDAAATDQDASATSSTTATGDTGAVTDTAGTGDAVPIGSGASAAGTTTSGAGTDPIPNVPGASDHMTFATRMAGYVAATAARIVATAEEGAKAVVGALERVHDGYFAWKQAEPELGAIASSGETALQDVLARAGVPASQLLQVGAEIAAVFEDLAHQVTSTTAQA